MTARQPAADGAIRCGAAVSVAPRLDAAVREAAELAAAALGDGRPADLAVVLACPGNGELARPTLEGLADLVPARTLLAATAEGVLAGDEEHESGPAVAVWLARLPAATIQPVSLEYEQTPDGGMFAGWPQDGPAAADGATLLLLADPFSFPIDAFLRRLEDDRPGLPVLGGMASGGGRPGSNTLVVNGATYDSGAVGVMLGGGVRVRPVVSQGCRPIGRPLVVTRSDENVIVELGGRPALERLREIYGTLPQTDRELVRSSLHVGRAATEYKERFDRGDFLVRNVVGADPESGVIAIGDAVRTGQTVQFHVRDAVSADEDLREMLLAARAAGARPAGALVFTCNGRGTRLFDDRHHDARCVRDCLGPIATAGFFAQGEIGPIGRKNCLHGFTASIALVEPA